MSGANQRVISRRAVVVGLTATTGLLGGRALAEETPFDEIVFDNWAGPPIVVPFHRPTTAGADAPFLFVMHGVARGAHGYLKAWRRIAASRGWIVAAPKFDTASFPKAAGYQIGLNDDPAQSSHAAIEPLFDAFRAKLGLERERYWMFGHSAGSQFTHRFLFRTGGPRLERAVCANAGWYFMPDPTAAFPYGLVDAGPAAVGVTAALGKPVTVLLGEEDRKRDGSVRQTPGAEAQGPHRVARGKAFFAAAEALASAREVPFRWRLAFAPGVGHSNAKIAPFAAASLAGERTP